MSVFGVILVWIFPHSDCMDSVGQNISEYRHFSRSESRRRKHVFLRKFAKFDSHKKLKNKYFKNFLAKTSSLIYT